MSPTQTAAGDGRIKRSASGWSDLPDDILGAVRSRIAASRRDLVRFAAVCKPWRAAASGQPALHVAPLMLLSSLARNNHTDHLCGIDLDDSWVFRRPSKAANMRFIGSQDGGWVALLDKDSYTLAIMNLFSGANMVLSKKQRKITSMLTFFIEPFTFKIIFFGDPTSSSGCILAAIIEGCLQVTLCKVGCHDGRWIPCQVEKLIDIAFCNGELYGLTSRNGVLIKFEIGIQEDYMLGVTAIQYLPIQRPTFYDDSHMLIRYIFELHGKPTMAVRTQWLPNLEPFFKVFELVDIVPHEAYKHKWAEVTSFGDYALFIGPTRSKAVHVPMSAENGGLKGNQTYYTKYTHSFINKSDDDEVNSVTSADGDYITMYCKKDQSFEDGIERTGYYVTGFNYAVWVHPPDL